METKKCSRCQETKTLDKFYKDYTSTQKDGIDYYCKYCRVGSAIKSHRDGNRKPCSVSDCTDKHYAKDMCRKHYARMKRHGSIYSLNDIVEDGKVYKYAKKEITYRREYMLMYQYKMTKQRYDELKALGCQICGEHQERNLHVDHDHNCCNGNVTCGNCVRGLLCNKCNQTVGKYETGLIRDDNPLKDKIQEYLNG